MDKNQAFFDVLIERGILTTEDASKIKKTYNGDAFKFLLRLAKGAQGGPIGKEDLGKIWGDLIGFPFVDLRKTFFQTKVVEKLPEDMARKYTAIPIYELGQAVTLATGDPENTRALLDIESALQVKVSPVFAFPNEIKDAIAVQYKSTGYLKELTSALRDKFGIDHILGLDEEITPEQLKKLAGSQAIVEIVRGIMLFALKEKASDIHFEPFLNKVHVRFRIDGVLEEKLILAKPLHLPMVSRIKILANLDITERRRPQDGRITLSMENFSVDFRFSCVPTVNGEKIVLRLLGQMSEKSVPDLEDLGFSPKDLEKVKQMLKTPNGVIFVTGPTGSGKTTTLFAGLKYLNRPEVNIVTIEDPVEYHLPGVNQVQVNHQIDMKFATALRSFLRQDPDVILVGEVRDVETAKIASQAALTGHLVLTTMHTNNALQAVTRLVEIGVEPFLVAPSVIGVIAQRLVRKLCEKCKRKYELTAEEIGNYFKWDRKTPVYFYHPKGCEECKFSGYNGRMAIYEMFVLTDDIRELIAKNSSILDIQKIAMSAGFKTLRYNGLKAVLRGVTSIEEVDQFTLKESELYVH